MKRLNPDNHGTITLRNYCLLPIMPGSTIAFLDGCQIQSEQTCPACYDPEEDNDVILEYLLIFEKFWEAYSDNDKIYKQAKCPNCGDIMMIEVHGDEAIY